MTRSEVQGLEVFGHDDVSHATAVDMVAQVRENEGDVGEPVSQALDVLQIHV